MTTLEKVKIVLGIPEAVTKIDDILQAMTDAANAEILQYLCLDQADVKLYQVVADFPYDRVDRVRMGPRPVVGVSSVTLYSRALQASEYRLAGNVVRLCGTGRCHGRGHGLAQCRAFTADVQAGFVTVPASLEIGVAQLAAQMYSLDGGGLKRKKINHYEIEWRSPEENVTIGGEWPRLLTSALGPYMRASNMITATVDP